MIFFLIIFLVIIAASFILAYTSMKDFQEIPSVERNGVYLIQKPDALTKELLEDLRSRSGSEVISLERLFKGKQSALVIFGQKKLLEQFSVLNLLELEDYSKMKGAKTAWEMAIKGSFPKTNIFDSLPDLNSDEQFWFQLLVRNKSRDWQGTIRAVVLSDNEAHRKELSGKLQTLANIVKVPRPLTSEQIYNSFTKRAFAPALQNPFPISSDQILKILGKA